MSVSASAADVASVAEPAPTTLAAPAAEKATTMITEKITIALSDRSPVRIDPEHWPVISSASRHDGRMRAQANKVWEIEVREHADGRRIVSGSCNSGPGGCYEGFRPAHAGYLLDHDADTVRAIRRVAGAIGDELLGDECIADLPAEDIS